MSHHNFKPDQNVQVLDNEVGVWYEAVIKEILEGSKAVVCYKQFNITETIEIDELIQPLSQERLLPRKLKINRLELNRLIRGDSITVGGTELYVIMNDPFLCHIFASDGVVHCYENVTAYTYQGASKKFSKRSSAKDAKKTSAVDDAKKTSAVDDSMDTSSVDDSKKTSVVDDAEKASAVDDAKKASAVDDAKETSAVDDAKKKSSVNDAKKKSRANHAKKKSSTNDASNIPSDAHEQQPKEKVKRKRKGATPQSPAPRKVKVLSRSLPTATSSVSSHAHKVPSYTIQCKASELTTHKMVHKILDEVIDVVVQQCTNSKHESMLKCIDDKLDKCLDYLERLMPLLELVNNKQISVIVTEAEPSDSKIATFAIDSNFVKPNEVPNRCEDTDSLLQDQGDALNPLATSFEELLSDFPSSSSLTTTIGTIQKELSCTSSCTSTLSDDFLSPVPDAQKIPPASPLIPKSPSMNKVHAPVLASVTGPENNSPSKMGALKEESASRQNFAWKMAKQLFTKSILMTSNCRGIGKNSLDPIILGTIKKQSFTWYPLERGEKEYIAWRNCEKAIDKGIRALRLSSNK